MAEIGGTIRNWLRGLVTYVWRYLGTLSAMGLLLGVLGTGIYHVVFRDESASMIRYYTGLFNSAGPEAPLGRGEIMAGDEIAPTPHVRFEYTPDGRLQRLVNVGGDGVTVPLSGSKVAEQRLEYDADGRLVAKRNFDQHGRLVPDSSGVAIREFSYDGQGRLRGRILKDASGRKIVPRMPGFAEEKIEYDDRGRPVRITYLDGEGKPIVNSRGESCIVYSYDPAGSEVVRTNYVNGEPSDNCHGVAVQRQSSTKDGLLTHTSWLASDGSAVDHVMYGARSVLVERKPAEKMHRERYCNRDGTMRDQVRTWAEHLVRTTPHGAVEWECFNGADGLPCVNPVCGFAERVCEYDRDGDLLREYFWDDRGNPAACYEKRYSSSGKIRHVLSLHTDGSTEIVRIEHEKAPQATAAGPEERLGTALYE